MVTPDAEGAVVSDVHLVGRTIVCPGTESAGRFVLHHQIRVPAERFLQVRFVSNNVKSAKMQ